MGSRCTAVHGETYHVNIFDNNSFAVPVDLLNDIDFALVAPTHNTNLVTFGEEDVLPTLVLGDGRGV